MKSISSASLVHSRLFSLVLLLTLILIAGCSKGSGPVSTDTGGGGEPEFSPMIRTLNSWGILDNPVHENPEHDYNVDTSNVVLGKSYFPNGPGIPGRSMNPDFYPFPQLAVSVSVGINAQTTSNPGQSLLGVYVQDAIITPQAIIPPPHNKVNHPAVTAHLEDIDGEHLVIIDVVYENDDDTPGDPDIYHMRFIQGNTLAI